MDTYASNLSPAMWCSLLIRPCLSRSSSLPSGTTAGERREEAMGRCSRVRHVVWLRQILRRWKVMAAAAAAAMTSSRRSGWAAPSDVPLGHVAVCVGSSSRRFVVRVTHLNHPVFRQLLRQAEEVYGFPSRSGPVALPCDESLFEDVLCLVSFSSSSSSSRFANCNLEDCDFNNIR
ncbi:unnamed protein product [Musa textilis]